MHVFHLKFRFLFIYILYIRAFILEYIIKSMKRARIIEFQMNEIMSERENYIIMRTKSGANNNIN